MQGMLKVGDRFGSFADVKTAIEELGKNTYTTFWKRDARTIASSKIARSIESSLMYYQLVYACNHGGKKFKSAGKQIRQSWTYKQDCPVHVRFKASSDGKSLEVTSVHGKHNHDTSKVLHAHTSSRRRLSSKRKERLKDALNTRANKKMVQWTTDHYEDNQETLTSLLEDTEMTEQDSSNTSTNNQSVSQTTHQCPPPNTYTKQRRKCLLLCAELADLAAQCRDTVFEQRLNVLKDLKLLWANDADVAIVQVDDGDENPNHFIDESND